VPVESVLPAIRQRIAAIDPALPLVRVQTLTTVIEEAAGDSRLSSVLTTVFALLAAVLATVGIYSVISYSVAQRHREIGIRVALGADSRRITRLVLGEGLLLAGIGVGLGSLAAVGLTRTLGTMLSSGVPILDALEIVAKSAGNRTIEKAVMYVRAKIAEGKNVAAPLAETGVFPPMVVQMINVGEQTGGLDEMLSKIADFYDEEVDVAVSAGGRKPDIDPGQFFDADAIVDGGHASTAVPLVDLDARQTERREPGHQVHRKLLRLVPFHDTRTDLGFGKFTHGPAKERLLLAQPEVHLSKSITEAPVGGRRSEAGSQ